MKVQSTQHFENFSLIQNNPSGASRHLPLHKGGLPQKPKENHLTEIKEVKESVEIVNCSYGWLLFLAGTCR